MRTAKGRLANTWTLVSVTDDGVAEPLVGVTTMEIKKDGTFTMTITVGSLSDSETGTWEFNSDKTKVKMSHDGHTDEYDIVQLKNKDLKLKDDHGGHDEITTWSGL